MAAIIGYVVANNASEITKDPAGSDALYGASITFVVLTVFSGVYNAFKCISHKCCSANVVSPSQVLSRLPTL